MITYTVIQGDNLWKIAAKHGITLKELLNANPQITNSSLIYPGQKINVPGTNSSTYIIKSGDTLWSIARRYGISLDNLLKINPQIINPSIIYKGQIINVPSSTSIPSTPSTTNGISALEDEVIRLVNNERRKAGVSPLTENSKLSDVARIKSKDFIDNEYFSHNSPVYGSPFDMIKSFKIPFTAAAENIANGQRSAAEVMSSWMSSSGHRANILSSTYNQIGVGVAKDKNGNLFWTQMFIKS